MIKRPIRFIHTTVLATAVAGLLLPAIGGCHSTDTVPSPGVGDPYPPPGNDPQISVVSPELRPWLGFQPAVIVKDEHHPMAVEIPVRNSTYNKYLVEYRYLFYDNAGLEIEPQMGWTMADLEPKQIVRLKGKALDTRAENYRLEVRWSQ
jgi:uncharacterized protein YcfL